MFKTKLYEYKIVTGSFVKKSEEAISQLSFETSLNGWSVRLVLILCFIYSPAEIYTRYTKRLFLYRQLVLSSPNSQ